MMSTLEEHLSSFTPSALGLIDTARWALTHADEGDWLSTDLVGGELVTVASVVENLRLGEFLDTSDPWAPVMND